MATFSYIVARGNLAITLLVMVLLGIHFRLSAYRRLKRDGREKPPWWKWL